jgi:ElaB/YqjD/DUF883 family membrane-anchored ribosome-binding protein
MDSQKLDPPTPDERTPEDIERDMAHTRDSITQKVAALESQVMGTVQSAADTVTSTVAAVKELVSTGPGALSDTVKDSLTSVGDVVKEQLDFSKKIRENPWESLAAAAAGGFVVGLLAFGRPRTAETAQQTPAAREFVAPPPSQGPREPTLLDGVWDHVRKELTTLAEEAWKTASESLRNTLHNEVPNFVKTTVETGTSGLTNRLKSQNLL